MKTSRRQLLQSMACGFGSVALTAMTAPQAVASEASANPLKEKAPHFKARAKRIIFVYLHGGLSHVDSFDPKPELTRLHGQPSPIEKPKFPFAPTNNLLGSPWKFRRYGQSGTAVSDLFPIIGRNCIDDCCVIRSLNGNQVAHGGASLQLHTGDGVFARPSAGAWILYGLGSENQNLPGFITISPSSYHGGSQNYGSAFLPASYQGTRIGDGNTPFDSAKMSNLAPGVKEPSLQRLQLDLLKNYNRRHWQQRAHDNRLDARIESFELAFRMQMTAPAVMDLSGETKETKRLYGIGGGPTDDFGKQCLLGRRFAEQGVRFVQVSHSYPRAYWDAHSGLQGNHSSNAVKVDRPIAGLIEDLKRRGMLNDTLVVIGTEFGRSPAAQGTNGRDHHPQAFSILLAGGGIRGGITYGETDDFGYYPVKDGVHTHDFHATLLHLLGLDHERLTYRYSGRDYRLTDVHGRVCSEIFV